MIRGKRIFITLVVIALVAAFFLGIAQRFRKGVPGKATIAVLRLEGPILDVRWHLEEVENLRKNDRIKGVLLRIDSPGGAVAPTQELYRELNRLRQEKPVVTSMGTIAASGGYYLACATDWIVCNPGTLTGSVGVIMEFTNLQELFRKIGVGTKTIKSGRFKDLGNPAREMTPEEEHLLKEMILDTYEQFVQAVLEGRKLDEDSIRPYLDGRVLTGRQALNLGLVDQMGNINDALMKVSELAGLPEVPEDIYEPEKEKPGLVHLLFGKAAAQALESFAGTLRDSGNDRWLQLWRVF